MTVSSFHQAPWHETLGWCPDEQQLHRFIQLYECVLAGNQKQNLTRILGIDEFWEKHLWDSLRGIRALVSLSDPPSGWEVIDIGTGAGFPGLPLAIVCASWSVTLLDSTRRRIQFVQDTLTTLGLPHVQAEVERAEHWAQHHRDRYDLAVSRALAAAPVCAEYSLPLLKLGGAAILYRGQWTSEEDKALTRAVDRLGGTLEAVDAFTTPLTGGVRHSLVIRKTQPTLTCFPRDVGIPQRRPLG